MILDTLQINPSYELTYQYINFKKSVDMASGDTAEYYISKEKYKNIAFNLGPLDNKDRDYVNAFYMAHQGAIPFMFKGRIWRFNRSIKFNIDYSERFYYADVSLVEYAPNLLTYNSYVKIPKDGFKKVINNRELARKIYSSNDESLYTKYVINIYNSTDIVYPIFFGFINSNTNKIVYPSRFFYTPKSYENINFNLVIFYIKGLIFKPSDIISALANSNTEDYLNNKGNFGSYLIKDNLTLKDILKYYRAIYKQLTERVLYYPFKIDLNSGVILNVESKDIKTSFIL